MDEKKKKKDGSYRVGQWTATETKSKSTSRVSARGLYDMKIRDGESVPPNTQETSMRSLRVKLKTAILPFGRPVMKKTVKSSSTTRNHRRRHHSLVSPVRRSFIERRESDSSSSHSVQDTATQMCKLKIIEKSRQKAKTQRRAEEDANWVQQFDEAATPADTAEETEPLRTACSMATYEKNIASCLKSFADMCATLSVDMLRYQFYSLPKPDPKDYVVFAAASNACKNRYSNVPCLDISRILLEFLLLEGDGGYIHANRVTYPLLRNQFILTQGPLPRTVPEFWRMIWQEKVETIIMLCKNIEYGKRRCAEYFSRHIDMPTSYVNGLLTTILRSRYIEGDMIISTIELKYLDNSRTVIHYQWAQWPDCQAPAENARSMFTMLRRVRGSSTPVVIHCSAGVGRSGTMVALEMCLMTIANLKPIDIHGIVSNLRRCRALAVQTLEQYLSLYKLVLTFGQQNGCLAKEDVSSFFQILQEAQNPTVSSRYY